MTSLSTQAEEAQKNRLRPAFYASSSVLMLAGMSSAALIQLSTNDNVVRGESVVVSVLSSDCHEVEAGGVSTISDDGKGADIAVLAQTSE
jgi:hypothetical protein